MTRRYRALAALSMLLTVAPALASPQEPGAQTASVTPVRKGPGVVMPRIRKETKPSFTADAMRMKLRGFIRLEAVVLADGTVGSVEAVSCDLTTPVSNSTSEKDAKAREELSKSKFVPGSCAETFGLAETCIKTVKQWQFTPGTKDGVAVPVLVDVEMTFTLR